MYDQRQIYTFKKGNTHLIETEEDPNAYRTRLLEHCFHALLSGTYRQTRGELPIPVLIEVDDDVEDDYELMAVMDEGELQAFRIILYMGLIDDFFRLHTALEICLNNIIKYLH